jgi:hypothetical protein
VDLQHGWTLLHYAAESENVDAVKFVLGLGLEIDAKAEVRPATLGMEWRDPLY